MTGNDPQPLITALTAWESGDLAKSIERAPERPAERPERAAPRPRPAAASRDALFDAPYVPGETTTSATAPARPRPTQKKPVAALFRSPVKPDAPGQ